MKPEQIISNLLTKQGELNQQEPPKELHPAELMILNLAKHCEATEKRVKSLEEGMRELSED